MCGCSTVRGGGPATQSACARLCRRHSERRVCLPPRPSTCNVRGRSNRVPEVDTSTHLGVGLRLAPWSSRSLLDQSELHVSFRCKAKAPARCRCKPRQTHLQVCLWRQALSTTGVLAAETTHARTLSRPPPRTVEQPQACSISLSCMVAFVAKPKQPDLHVFLSPGGKHSPPPECQRQRRSTHLESASASHRGAAASLLDQLAVHGGSDAKANNGVGAGAWSY